MHVVDVVSKFDHWFQQGPDATGRLRLSTLQKCIATFKMLAYGGSADAYDEYVTMGKSKI